MLNLIKAHLGMRTVKSTVNNGSRVEKWTTDIEFIEKELPKRHKNLFFELDETYFYSQLKYIKTNINGLSDEEIHVKLMELIASVKDGHTRLYQKSKNLYALKFYVFDDGIFLTHSSEDFSEHIGSELIAVGNTDITQVEKLLSKCISADNHQQLKNSIAHYLVIPEVLKGLGLADNHTVYTFRKDGIISSIKVTPSSSDALELKKGPEMMHLSNLKKNYWYQFNPDNNCLYFQYNLCENDKNMTFKVFNRDMFKTIDNINVKKIIVDLRHNGGGASWILNPFFRSLKKRPDLNKSDKLYVIIGRETFSSALMNTIRFMKKTRATLIGEGTGGAPNGYGEIMFLKLMNTNLHVIYSTQYFKQLSEELDCIEPDVKVPNLSNDYFEGKDLVFNAIE